MLPAPALLLCFALAACGSAGPVRPDPGPPPPPHPVRLALAPGTALTLTPVAVSGGGSESSDVLTGLLREALVQTAAFDLIAPPLDGAAGEPAIHVHADLAAGTLAATLVRDGAAPVPLAAAPFERNSPDRALDTVALQIRQSLGENVPALPIPCALVYSHHPEAVVQGELGWNRFLRGDLAGAQDAFERGRRQDGGSPVILAGLVACTAMGGDATTAARIAQEALAYDHRLHSPARHRLTRALLLARAARNPLDAQSRDRELLQLAQVTHRERPHDVEPKISMGLAHNFLGEHDQAVLYLRPMHRRLPTYSLVAYHLAYAELALERPEASLLAIESIGNRLPVQSTALPRALALFHAGRHKDLSRHLKDLGERPEIRHQPARHEVLRMRAAHAILLQDRQTAVQLLLEDVSWLRDHPSLLEDRAVDLAEAGEVLVRLGAHGELGQALRGFDDLGNLPAPIMDALVFLGGLVESATTGERATVAEASLARRHGKLEVWGNVVKAFGHHQRGELADEAAALARAAVHSDAPLIKAALAHAWRAMGQTEESEALLDALRREQYAIDLRLPRRHPLVNPAVALACLQ